MLANAAGTKMGNSGSRKKSPWRKPKKDQEGSGEDGRDEELSTEPETETERTKLKSMRTLLKEKPSVFILNNLLLSVQLFSNYEKEIEKAREEVKAREDEMNKNLMPDKMVLIPDVLREHFDGRLRFTSSCKSDKDEQTVEPLRPVQMYLVYENVLVTEHEELRHYSTAGELNVEYTFVLREAGHKGYARLEQISRPTLKRSQDSDNTDLSSIVKNRDEIFSEDESLDGPFNGTKRSNDRVAATSMPNLHDDELYYEDQNSNSTQDLQTRNKKTQNKNSRISRPHHNSQHRASIVTNPSLTSSSSSSYGANNYTVDSDSDYSSYQSSSRPSSFSQSRPSMTPIDASEIPNKCFKRVTYMYNGRIYNPRKEQKPLTSQQRRIRDEKLTHNYDVVYVNGYKLAKHFYEAFVTHLAKRMDFDEKVVRNAKRSDATIRLEKIDYLSAKNYTSIEQYEVIPCLASPWPRWARKWIERPRVGWPSDEVVSSLERSYCYLVPESLKQIGPEPSNSHPLWRLDWNLSFPTAERYLETCLSSTQMTVFAIALMVHKTFIKTVSSMFGLDTRHIRNMVFWMAERQPLWSEHEMGKSIMILLESLHNHIQQRVMHDYFMHDRNLFSSVHTDELLHSQKQLKRIIENPVMFIFHAMEKIHYERTDYPRLNYKELLRLLTVNELLLINPLLEMRAQREAEEIEQSYGKRQLDKGKFWNEAKQTNQFYLKTRKRSNNTFLSPKQMFDSIIDIQEKCEVLTRIRLSKLLIFFSEHFLKMARSCIKVGSSRQKDVYLNHTRLLAFLLADDPEYKRRASKIIMDVQTLRDIIIVTNSYENVPPETPKRNSDQPVITRSAGDRYSYPSVVEEESEYSLDTNNNNSNNANNSDDKNTMEVEVSVHASDVDIAKSVVFTTEHENLSAKSCTKTVTHSERVVYPETTSF